MAGNPCILTITGGTSSNVGGGPAFWTPDWSKTPFSVTISGDMNSTATTPNWGVWVTNDAPQALLTASTTSATVLNISSIYYPNSSVTWYTSFGATNSSNALINITAPFRYLTIVATAGTSNGSITATVIQVG